MEGSGTRMKAGILRHRVELQEKILPVERNEFGENDPTEWVTISQMYASIMPLSARELIIAQQMQSEITHKINIRYRVGITVENRVKYKDRVFNITGVINFDERNREIQLTCTESV